MNDAKSPEEAPAWHRRFAAASNNRAWDLSVQTRNGAEDEEMLQAAHASAWHWSKVGTELNQMRATLLLAEVHALVGLGGPALRYAEKMREYFLRVGAPDWETAFVHTVHAHAAYAAGEVEAHRTSYRLAVAAVQAVASEEEQRIVAGTFSHVPKP